MTRSLVTIGMSFFNDETTIEEAIVSVLNQSFQDWNLVLLEDGSTDRSADIASRYSDRRIRLIRNSKNEGLIARLNQLVAMADGKYFARMDADDLMHRARLSRQVQYLESHPDIDAVDSAMYSIDTQGVVTGVRGTRIPDWTLASILRGNVLNHATVTGKTAWFKAHPYDHAYPRAEDMELWCRTVSESRFARISDPLYFVREGDINVRSHLLTKKTLRSILRRYGPEALSRGELLKLVLLAYVKEYLYRLFGAMGMQRFLAAARNRRLTAVEMLAAESALRRARASLQEAVKEQQ